MKLRQLGDTKLKVSEIGLGCMGMSQFNEPTDEATSIAVLHQAVERGVNFLDTADVYGSGANETLLAQAFKNHWGKIILATKCAVVQDPAKDYIKNACDASLERLEIDVIDLYYLHRLDKQAPIEESMEVMADLVKAGKVRYIGLSAVSPDELFKAHQIHPITALQAEYSLVSRGVEKDLLSLCERLSISVVAYRPLCDGFLTNRLPISETQAPLFKQKMLEHRPLFEVMDTIAEQLNCTRAQLALAWILAKSKQTIPIPGAKSLKHVEENIEASRIQLSSEQIHLLDSYQK